jgi:hypothetical protein
MTEQILPLMVSVEFFNLGFVQSLLFSSVKTFSTHNNEKYKRHERRTFIIYKKKIKNTTQRFTPKISGKINLYQKFYFFHIIYLNVWYSNCELLSIDESNVIALQFNRLSHLKRLISQT